MLYNHHTLTTRLLQQLENYFLETHLSTAFDYCINLFCFSNEDFAGIASEYGEVILSLIATAVGCGASDENALVEQRFNSFSTILAMVFAVSPKDVRDIHAQAAHLILIYAEQAVGVEKEQYNLLLEKAVSSLFLIHAIHKYSLGKDG